jgi:DNA-binding transcriptional LysR family regulator
MDRLDQLTAFVKVVQAGGFAASGRGLGISPSRTTMHIQALGARRGVRLLNRSTREVSLTEIGKSYERACTLSPTQMMPIIRSREGRACLYARPLGARLP